MKKLLVLTVAMVFLAVLSGAASAQPEATGYTLSDIYYYLTEGVESGEGAHSLEPPEGSVPGDSSSQTVDQIYEDIKALYEQCNVTPGQVMEAVTYFSADTDNWGPRVGTIPVKDSFSGADGDKVIDIPDGYYATKTVTAQDNDLVSGNIRSGVNIFGVSGNSSVVDTGAGDASASDILQGKKAYVAGSEVTGNIAGKGAHTYTPGTSNQTIDAGQYLSGTQTISGDGDLVADKIKEGENIFGVAGTFPSDGTATDPQVLSGKYYYSDTSTRRSGSMTSWESWTSTRSTQGTTAIPAGYHDGSGNYTCDYAAEDGYHYNPQWRGSFDKSPNQACTDYGGPIQDNRGKCIWDWNSVQSCDCNYQLYNAWALCRR